MKTWDEINVDEVLPFEDFFTLFNQLPLNEQEKESLAGYYGIYDSFINAEVKPRDAWIAVRNIFAVKERHIAERIKNSATSELKL